MSEAAATIEIGGDAAAPKKSKKMLIIIIAVVVVVLAAGGGGGYWYWSKKKAEEAAALEAAAKGKKGGAKGKAGAHGEEGATDEEEEAASEEDEEAAAEDAPKKPAASAAAFRLPDDSKVKEVIELQPFIINLADPGEIRYLRLTASVGVGGGEEGGGGGEGGKVDPLLTTRIRNAMLAVLTTRTSEEVLTVQGKAKLRADLLRVARKAAKEAHIEAVYITEFIVQM